MKRYRPPAQSGAHRTACLALYRALLQPIPHILIAPSRQKSLHKYITRTFRRNRDLQSTRILTHTLRTGYEGEQLLRTAAAGDAASTARVVSLLDALVPVKATTATATPRATPEPTPKAVHRLPAPYPGAIPILARPHLHLTGRRHVPTLVSAGGNPMLRIKKPQSPFLSRVLRDKVAARQKQFDRLMGLEGEIEEAEMEDEWDVLVGGGEEWEPRWVWPLEEEKLKVEDWLREDERKKVALSQKFLEIVDKETGLRDEEKREAARRKWERWRVRKGMRKMEEKQGIDGEGGW
ncbi:MAG: hypothetical protein M1833_007399 [Piccolia ochrophora]|nr:MAG: hypothetical protein M1833_007399 [Piccolia ochrophora]